MEQQHEGYIDNNQSDNTVTSADIKSRLQEALRQLSAAMCFISCGEYPRVNPGISIIGVKEDRTISLPLTASDAQFMFNGSETIVRNTRELSADAFELANPKWLETLQVVLDKVAEELYVPGGATSIKAVLDKLLLYGKEAMSKKLHDSEKEPTLLIFLPSEHEGGYVRVTHGSQSKTLKISKYTYAYISCCGDIEIDPVTSGNMLILKYKLINNKPAKEPVELDGMQDELKETLVLWKEYYMRADRPTFLAYMLENVYPKEALSGYMLDRLDYSTVECLVKLGREHGFLILLANLKHGVRGLCDGGDDESMYQDMYPKMDPPTRKVEFDDLLEDITIDGEVLFDNTPVGKSHIIQEDPFPDDLEELSGSKSEAIIATVVIVMPVEFYYCFIIGADDEIVENKLSEWFEEAKVDGGLCMEENLSRVCWFLVKRAPSYNPKTDYELEMVMRCSLFLNDADLCREAVLRILRKFPKYTVNEAIQQFGFTKIKSGLNCIHRFRYAHQILQSIIDTYDAYAALPEPNPETLNDILMWMKDQAMRVLTVCSLYNDYDGAQVAEVAVRCDEAYLIKQLVPAIQCLIKKGSPLQLSPMYSGVLGFLTGVAALEQDGNITRGIAQQVFRTVLTDFIPSMKLVGEEDTDEAFRSSLLGAEAMMRLLKQCVILEIDLQPVCEKPETLAHNEHPRTAFGRFFIPVAKYLQKVLSDEDFKEILKLYARRCVDSSTPENRVKVQKHTLSVFDRCFQDESKKKIMEELLETCGRELFAGGPMLQRKLSQIIESGIREICRIEGGSGEKTDP